MARKTKQVKFPVKTLVNIVEYMEGGWQETGEQLGRRQAQNQRQGRNRRGELAPARPAPHCGQPHAEAQRPSTSALNHVSGVFRGITGVYQQHDYADEIRIALQKWADRVEEIVGGEPAKIFALRGKR